MRTTIPLADDVAAAVEELRRRQECAISDVVNALLRRGVSPWSAPHTVRQATGRLGVRHGGGALVATGAATVHVRSTTAPRFG